PVEWAKEAEGLGAGEILLTSIDRDGTMDGYDVPLTRSVCEAVRIPVVASGGAGNYAHMAEVLKDGGATAVAASSIFLFTEQTPKEAKLYLKEQGFNVRI
ncbi:MAG: imidazole glycerol phosphate synthase cyclase subunit, partial [Rhodospirillaceae bacterium]|nr:imidazole glycerol phosphate synthase cyclase subunit [Rhodospirillaceae bacterium]